MGTSWRVAAMPLVFALTLAACKDDDSVGPIEGAPPAELVGTWSMQSVTVNGQPASLADVLEWDPNTASSDFTVETSGVYTYRELNVQGVPTFLAAGTITISGNGFTISVSSVNGTPIPAQRQSGTWELVQGELRLTTQEDFQGSMATVVLVCVRK